MSESIMTELQKIRSKYKDIEGIELISCVPAIVQLKYSLTDYKQIVMCFHFPSDYPSSGIILELKSKTLPFKLLDGLRKICEHEALKFLGQEQVLMVARFVKAFVLDNPLCACSEEIAKIKTCLLTEDDVMKLKQKSSQITLKLRKEKYKISARLTIPNDYPVQKVNIEILSTNYPEALMQNFASQAVEISRKCIEAPLRPKKNAPKFKAKPSLFPVVDYLINDISAAYPNQCCPLCHQVALPDLPEDVVTHTNDDKFVDRLYCGHLFHRGCLDVFMKKPPFKDKKCARCQCLVFHKNWVLPPSLREARWANQEARARELSEVADFLQ